MSYSTTLRKKILFSSQGGVGFPDYNNTFINLNIGDLEKGFTAPYNGWLIMSMALREPSKLLVNNKEIARAYWYDGFDSGPILIPLSAKDTIKYINGGYSFQMCIFVKAKWHDSLNILLKKILFSKRDIIKTGILFVIILGVILKNFYGLYNINKFIKWILPSQDKVIGFPDYSHGYPISLPFTVNQNGYFYVHFYQADTINRILINNATVLEHQSYNADSSNDIFVPVHKGDIIQYEYVWGRGDSLKNCIFYPML